MYISSSSDAESFQKRNYKIEDFPVSYDNYSREITLPVYPQLSDDEVKKL